jgi:hypothetical protein
MIRAGDENSPAGAERDALSCYQLKQIPRTRRFAAMRATDRCHQQDSFG